MCRWICNRETYFGMQLFQAGQKNEEAVASLCLNVVTALETKDNIKLHLSPACVWLSQWCRHHSSWQQVIFHHTIMSVSVCACRFHGAGNHWLTETSCGSPCVNDSAGRWITPCRRLTSPPGNVFTSRTSSHSREQWLQWWAAKPQSEIYFVHLKCKLTVVMDFACFIFFLFYCSITALFCFFVVIFRFICFFVYFNVGLIFLSSLSLILLYYYCV